VKSFSLQELFKDIESEKFQQYDLVNNPIEGNFLLNQEVINHTFICRNGRLILPKKSKLILAIKTARKILIEQQSIINGLFLKYSETDEYLVEVDFEKRRRLTEEDKEGYSFEGTGEEYVVLKFKKMNANRILKSLAFETSEDYHVQYTTEIHTFLEDKINGLDIFDYWKGYGSVPLTMDNELTFMDQALAETFQRMNPFINEMRKEKDQLPIRWTEIIESRNKQDLLNKKYKRFTFAKSINKYPLRYSYAFYKLKSKVTVEQLNKMQAFVQKNKSIDVFPSEVFQSKKNTSDFYMRLLESYLIESKQIEGFNLFDGSRMIFEDIYNMSQILNKKVSLNFKTIKGMKRYHDSLVELLNKRTSRTMKDFVFSFPKKFNRLIDMIERDNRFEVIKTHKELFLEGVNMHHCVYSYLDLVIDGTCVILKYKDGKYRYTIEVRKRKNGRYIVRQCYGKYDSLPESEIEKMIKTFIESVPYREMKRA